MFQASGFEFKVFASLGLVEARGWDGVGFRGFRFRG